jgi:hypothetical protein
MGSFQSFIQGRQAQGVKTWTINYGLQLTRHILNLAASEGELAIKSVLKKMAL